MIPFRKGRVTEEIQKSSLKLAGRAGIRKPTIVFEKIMRGGRNVQKIERIVLPYHRLKVRVLHCCVAGTEV